LDCKEAEELLPAYALNALSPQEAASVEAHLDTCPWCAALFLEHVQVAAALAQAAERFQPPQRLKDITLRAVRGHPRQRERSRRSFLWKGWRSLTAGHLAVGTASIAVLLIVIGLVLGLRMSNEIDDLRQENLELVTQVSQLAEDEEKLTDMFIEQRFVSYVIASPDKQVLPLQGSGTVPGAQGMLLVAARGGTGILMARGLEPSSGDEAYYVWLRKDGQPVTVGRLSVDEEGWGVLTLWPDQPITLFQQVWVTAEPAAPESPSPTGRPVLWGTIAPR